MGRVLAALVAGLLALGLAACGREEQGKRVVTHPKPPPQEPGHFDLSSHPKAVDVGGAGAAPQPAAGKGDGEGVSPGAQSDEEVRKEVKEADKQLASFSDHLDGASLATGARARVLPDGTAVAPRNAPDVVKRVILAGNQIAKFPYKWGGGHGAWRDSGYDCSGSVSFALAGAGFLRAPMASGEFMGWGSAGPGKWITIFANSGHIYMFVAGLRFDTSGRGRDGTRWQEAGRTGAGFAVRHPPHY